MLRILFISFIIFSCTEKKGVTTDSKINFYDSIDNTLSDSLKKIDLLALSDSIKWNLYCIYGNDSTSWGWRDKNLPHIPIGFCKLILRSFSQLQNDSAVFYYQFIFRDSIVIESYDERRKPIASQVMVKLSTKEVIGYGVDIFYSMDIDERYRHPLRVDIINFMKNNRNKLNPWFKKRAIERGIL